MGIRARIASGGRDYATLGLRPGHVQPFEDGMRTSGRAGTYEWWYFDARLSDGTKLVITFFTKPLVSPGRPLSPAVSVDLDLPDGGNIHRIADYPAASFDASTDGCDVRIGPNTFRGDLHRYRIHVELEGIEADVVLTGTVPGWRPGTGYWFFGKRDEYYFAWLPAVPQGEAEVSMTVGGVRQHGSGTGYHDHNWGNRPVAKLIDHWYWGRGSAGGYSVVTAAVTAAKRYGSVQLPVFLLAKDGQIVADDGSKAAFAPSGFFQDPDTGKAVPSVIGFDYRDGAERYLVTYTRTSTVLAARLGSYLPRRARLAARLAGFSGAYFRFSGTLDVREFRDGRPAGAGQAPALWELMRLGRSGQRHSRA
ncbi:hydroxyneurosporene dehydrogenase [Arthrobacter mobilis]|uniref:Hydroxyneurosporene dehydrogenase n=1 Tax=Arthrobacter mobilis TaxID=2724944 RepID=A0A7X6K6R5_9MICC|nr:hydroxyneurosporene dehydrogenase [Arthrobacter mobilis]NKX55820.1 hydroxyneurosporene dehydrogenase [Arthrobacter mobilis]